MRSFVCIVLALAMVGQAISSSESDQFEEPSGAVEMYSDVALAPESTAGDDSATNYVTPYSYKGTMTQNSKSGRQLTCWRCGSPCSNGFCCNDGFPKCCIRNGRCRCCRR